MLEWVSSLAFLLQIRIIKDYCHCEHVQKETRTLHYSCFGGPCPMALLIENIMGPKHCHQNIFAPGEARTHGLQIMRLTRCLLRYRGWLKTIPPILNHF